MLKHLVVGVELPFEEERFAEELKPLLPLIGLQKLTLLHVGADPNRAAQAREPLQKHAKVLKGQLQLQEIAAEVTSGLPAEELNRKADDLDADGLLLLFHNHSKTYEFFLGSVALNTARSTRHPLLLLTGQPDATSGTLMLSSDGSLAARSAEQLFNQLLPSAQKGVIINVQTDKDETEHDEAIQKLQSEYADDSKVELVRAQGDPIQEILQSARYHSVDLVILGKRGQNPLKQLMFGSTAESLCRQIKRPVLIVPAG